jgi:hypothetical protein
MSLILDTRFWILVKRKLIYLSNTDAITKVSLRGVLHLAGRRSHLEVKDERLPRSLEGVYPEVLEGLAMTIVTILNALVLVSRIC